MSDERRHDPALELLRDLDPKTVLSPEAKRRIAGRIEHDTSRSGSRWLWIAAPCLAALGFLAIRVTRPLPAAPSAPSHEIKQAFVVPACAVTRVADGESFSAALVGPASAQLSSTSGHKVSLRAGRFIVRANQQPVEIDGPDARVTVAPSSFAEIEVRELHMVRVALYSGRASVEIATSTFVVAEGNSWNGTEVHRTAQHDSKQATELLEPSAAPVQLCPAPSDAPPSAVDVEPATPAPSRKAKATTVQPPTKESLAPLVPVADPIAANRSASTEPPSTDDARQLADAIRRLRIDHDARGALAVLDAAPRSNAVTTFADEIALVRIEAFLDLGDRGAALAALDSLALPNVPRGEELMVLRGDLRAEAKRWAEAINDYSHPSSAATPQLVERSLFGRAKCRLATGEIAMAHSDLQDYLQRFPHGMFAADVRRLLAR